LSLVDVLVGLRLLALVRAALRKGVKLATRAEMITDLLQARVCRTLIVHHLLGLLKLGEVRLLGVTWEICVLELGPILLRLLGLLD